MGPVECIIAILMTLLVFRVVWQLTKKVLAMLAGLFLISLAGLAVFAVYSGVTSLVGMLLGERSVIAMPKDDEDRLVQMNVQVPNWVRQRLRERYVRTGEGQSAFARRAIIRLLEEDDEPKPKEG